MYDSASVYLEAAAHCTRPSGAANFALHKGRLHLFFHVATQQNPLAALGILARAWGGGRDLCRGGTVPADAMAWFAGPVD